MILLFHFHDVTCNSTHNAYLSFLKIRLHVVLQKPVYAYLFLNVKKILIIYHYNI